jgi:F0F1-type ATP synthase assembly protein I
MIAWERVLPVLVSIGVIILVAIVREHSRTFAAIAATMPINVPLALWIVFSADNDPASRTSFAEGLLIGILPTVLFLVVSWLVVRAGWPLIPTIIAGYVAWGIGLGTLLLIRRGLA